VEADPSALPPRPSIVMRVGHAGYKPPRHRAPGSTASRSDASPACGAGRPSNRSAFTGVPLSALCISVSVVCRRGR